LRDVQEEGEVKIQIRCIAFSYTKNSNSLNAVFQYNCMPEIYLRISLLYKWATALRELPSRLIYSSFFFQLSRTAVNLRNIPEGLHLPGVTLGTTTSAHY